MNNLEWLLSTGADLSTSRDILWGPPFFLCYTAPSVETAKWFRAVVSSSHFPLHLFLPSFYFLFLLLSTHFLYPSLLLTSLSTTGFDRTARGMPAPMSRARYGPSLAYILPSNIFLFIFALAYLSVASYRSLRPHRARVHDFLPAAIDAICCGCRKWSMKEPFRILMGRSVAWPGNYPIIHLWYQNRLKGGCS